MSVIHAEKVKVKIPGRTYFIRKSSIARIRSRARTHEGEILSGNKGREYMDKYSKRYLGKDMKDSWRDDKIRT